VALSLLDEDKHLLSCEEGWRVPLGITVGIDTGLWYLTDTAGTTSIIKDFIRSCGVGIVSGIDTSIAGIVGISRG
jgi:hypothetical protein